MQDNATGLDFVELYVTDDLVSIIVTKTNRYAHQCLLANAEKKENSYLHEWEETNVLEIKTFPGMLLMMKVKYKPQLPLYWSNDTLYNTPILSEVMSRNRFYLLLKFSHFNDNEDENYNANDQN